MNTLEQLNLTLLAKTVNMQVEERLTKALTPLIERIAQLEAEKNALSEKQTKDILTTARILATHHDRPIIDELHEHIALHKKGWKCVLEIDSKVRKLEKAIAELRSENAELRGRAGGR